MFLIRRVLLIGLFLLFSLPIESAGFSNSPSIAVADDGAGGQGVGTDEGAGAGESRRLQAHADRLNLSRSILKDLVELERDLLVDELGFEQSHMAGDELKSKYTPEKQAAVSPETVAFSLSLGVLVFCLVVMWTIVYLTKTGVFSDLTFKAVTLALLVSAGLFIITAGYSDEQLAPMMGLLGTLAGYILGKDASPKGQTQPASDAGPDNDSENE